MEGIIFDIQKFALHDGPGIRTVVFLKGCPANCQWCCNPESIALEQQLGFDSEKCKQHFNCVEVCKPSALKRVENELLVDYDKCNLCRDCIPECPTYALEIFGYKSDVETIMQEVLKDRAYYENSGGGITLSGGDPLFQFDFALEILKESKNENLNTCLETAGLGRREKFEQISPYVDHFLFDYKITDNELHKEYVGVSNKPILSNLDFLAKHNADIVLRSIILPGINDNHEHFSEIANLDRKYKSIRRIDIIPYHDYGRKKYKKLGKEYLLDIETVLKQRAEALKNKLIAMGCNNVQIGG
jgi:pyruvate formate lyase activating enzyme